jgi:hypothetical protein
VGCYIFQDIPFVNPVLKHDGILSYASKRCNTYGFVRGSLDEGKSASYDVNPFIRYHGKQCCLRFNKYAFVRVFSSLSEDL